MERGGHVSPCLPNTPLISPTSPRASQKVKELVQRFIRDLWFW